MKTRSKALLLSLCAVLLVVSTVFGTLAYLTDTETATNTFTVGDIKIKLDETKVNPDGTAVAGANRVGDTTKNEELVPANTYHLLPGHTYIKDPMVTVLAGSEESYIRMKVTVSFIEELDAIFHPAKASLLEIFAGYEDDNWSLANTTRNAGENTITYEFRYIGAANKGTKEGTVAKVTEDTALDALFDNLVVPGFINNDQLATLVKKDDSGKITDQMTITVVANAIQADGFADANAAWSAFDRQMNPSASGELGE